jgi:hypothetical protein
VRLLCRYAAQALMALSNAALVHCTAVATLNKTATASGGPDTNGWILGMNARTPRVDIAYSGPRYGFRDDPALAIASTGI